MIIRENELKTPPADMLNAAKTALKNAYAPYSCFDVAACVRAENNEIFTGCNVENISFSVGFCAEVGAIGALFTQGQRKITEVLVLVKDDKICPPCGACCQRLSEFASPNTLIHLCTLEGKYECKSLMEILPYAFGPHKLKEKQ